MKNQKLKKIKNIDWLSELPFYDELSIIKTDQAFKGYEMLYKVGIIDKKDPLAQLETLKTCLMIF